MPGVDGATAAVPPRESGRALTLDTNVDVILGLLCLSSIFVGFGEGVYVTRDVSAHLWKIRARRTEGGWGWGWVLKEDDGLKSNEAP